MGDRKKLIVILAVGLILRLGYGLYLGDRGLVFPDEFRYDRIAGELLEGKGFTSSFTSPGYPSFLAIIYGMEFQS